MTTEATLYAMEEAREILLERLDAEHPRNINNVRITGLRVLDDYDVYVDMRNGKSLALIRYATGNDVVSYLETNQEAILERVREYLAP